MSYLGFVHGTMAALARMRPRDRGTIVQVGSALGYRAIPLQSAYCGAKHAINGFTESVRCELLHDGSQRADHRRADARRQHAAVLLGAVPAAPPPAAGPADLPAGGRRRGDRLRRRPPGRKEHWVGASTVGTIVAQKIAAPLLDRYLARTGYDSQQTKEPADASQPTNLWQPVDQAPGSDRGAHGDFDDRSSSTQRPARRHRGRRGSRRGGTAGEALGRLKDGPVSASEQAGDEGSPS